VRRSTKIAGGVSAVVIAIAVLTHNGSSGRPNQARQPEVVAAAGPASEQVEHAAALSRPAVAAGLLQAARGGDGDSWHDTAGREYRLGLVNAPEYNECFGGAATAKRKELTAGGFRARVYTVDRYGRSVAVVTSATGINVNVYLARHGFANDRYLMQFRSENPALARQLDAAFAAARSERAGLWGACFGRGQRSSVAPSPAQPQAAPKQSGCHPSYATCIPVKGDGSGNGQANDLDCGDIRQRVTLRQVGVDPYRLDADGDGFGCDSYA
jgi:endonuclease YncB( thermonuclease family)